MTPPISYKNSGVDIDLTDAVKRDMKTRIDAGDPRVLNRMGAFGSLVEGRFEGLSHPVLVLKTEEPGSKQKLAAGHGRLASIGYDLVNHLINDVIVMGADPLYVQDCIVCGRIEPEIVKGLVNSMVEACRAQGAVLTGGETSVQPGVVEDGIYVLTASAVGVVDKEKIIDGSKIRTGDVVLAVAANGLHTNGYTLVRRLLDENPDLAGRKIEESMFIDIVLRPHLCYYPAVSGLLGHPGLTGLAHITGGGVQDNVNRILPSASDAVIDLGRYRVPAVFSVIREAGAVPDADMMRTFNLGIGLAAVCHPDFVGEISVQIENQGFSCYEIGHITSGAGQVRFEGAIRW